MSYHLVGLGLPLDSMVVSPSREHDQIKEFPKRSCQIKPQNSQTHLNEQVKATSPVLASPKWHDALFLLGAAFAILCQFAPAILAQGADKHSRFAQNPLRRMRRTIAYMTAVVWGSPSEREAVYTAVSRQHAAIKGANDPELHRWVASTLFMAFVKVHETFYGELPLWEKEELYQDCSVWATRLGYMPREMWFDSVKEFEAYWECSVEEFTITDEAKGLAHTLLFTCVFPWWMAWAVRFVRILTAGWLPPKFREAYGLPGPDTFVGSWGLAIIVGVIKYTYCLLPQYAKRKTHDLLMADMRAMVAGISTKGRWSR